LRQNIRRELRHAGQGGNEEVSQFRFHLLLL
jgi:hypothetical protein